MISILWALLQVPVVIDKPYTPLCTLELSESYFECKKIVDPIKKVKYYMDYCTEVNGRASIKKLSEMDSCYKQVLGL